LSGRLRDQLHLASQVVDASDQAQDYLLTIAAGEVLGTEVVVFDAFFQLW
jgi:hypothetical protein